MSPSAFSVLLALASPGLLAPSTQVPPPEPRVLNYAEQMPRFAGGEVALHRYLVAQLKYPALAWQRGQSGQVVVQFIVDEQGRVLEPIVVKTTAADFNEEARRLVWLMPRWEPGRDQGQPVRVRCTLPIVFTFKR